MKTLTVLVLALTSFASPGMAEELEQQKSVLSCWDHTFAYTRATITPNVGNPDTIMNVDLRSEAQDKFEKLLPIPHLAWGNVQVNFSLRKSECQFQNGRADLMSCESHIGSIYISYDESSEVQKTLRLRVGTLKFSTLIDSTAPRSPLKVQLSFQKFGESNVGSVELVFPTSNNTCF